jgi:60 kDa SS-A/Ro ribonucleoprotein
MQKLHKLFNPSRTPQNRPLDKEQIKNSAGGYVWELTPWQRLDRFLVLGTEGGTYYINEQTLTVENAQNVVALLKEDGVRVIDRVVEVSVAGRAYKNNAALFVLALAFTVGDATTKRAAEIGLPKVARTGTHLFTFMEYVNAMRGWGRGLRRAVASWYDSKELKDLAYQVTKYAQRNGWTHRDALRLAHPKTQDSSRDGLYRYITGHQDKIEDLRVKVKDSNLHSSLFTLQSDWTNYLAAVDAVKVATNVADVVEVINRHDLPREVIPTEMLNKAEVWEALLEKMPMTAMIRNLATMTRVGLLAPMSKASDVIAERLTDASRLRKARIHPIQVLAALNTYQAGRGMRGSGTWTPVQTVVDALDMAFYQTFENVEATGKRVLLALDVSGSMGMGTVGGVVGLTPRVASAAMALVTAATERNYAIMGFSTTFMPLNISPRQRLDDVVKSMSNLPFSGTDCALPMVWALEQNLAFDAFIVYTDNETYFGKIHPVQALNEYRRKMGITAKLIVVAMTGNKFSIADPNDAGMLDVVGFSTDTPNVMADFIRE